MLQRHCRVLRADRLGASVANDGYFGYLDTMNRLIPSAVGLLLFAAAIPAKAQTNSPAPDTASLTNRASELESSEKLRARCIAERRSICGRVLRNSFRMGFWSRAATRICCGSR